VSTRCKIIIKEGRASYAIYRHSDGYPEGVMADLKIALQRGLRRRLEDPEYFLANFIFMAKYSAMSDGHISTYVWFGYGVCSPTCRHGDLDYIYTIDANTLRVKVEEYDWAHGGMKTIFDGPLVEAFSKFNDDRLEHGCHINKRLFGSERPY